MLEAIRASGKPAIGHNLAFDLAYTLHSFAAPLPPTWGKFKQQVRVLFPPCSWAGGGGGGAWGLRAGGRTIAAHLGARQAAGAGGYYSLLACCPPHHHPHPHHTTHTHTRAHGHARVHAPPTPTPHTHTVSTLHTGAQVVPGGGLRHQAPRTAAARAVCGHHARGAARRPAQGRPGGAGECSPACLPCLPVLVLGAVRHACPGQDRAGGCGPACLPFPVCVPCFGTSYCDIVLLEFGVVRTWPLAVGCMCAQHLHLGSLCPIRTPSPPPSHPSHQPTHSPPITTNQPPPPTHPPPTHPPTPTPTPTHPRVAPHHEPAPTHSPTHPPAGRWVLGGQPSRHSRRQGRCSWHRQ